MLTHQRKTNKPKQNKNRGRTGSDPHNPASTTAPALVKNLKDFTYMTLMRKFFLVGHHHPERHSLEHTTAHWKVHFAARLVHTNFNKQIIRI